MYQCEYCEDDKWIGDGRVPCPKCNTMNKYTIFAKKGGEVIHIKTVSEVYVLEMINYFLNEGLIVEIHKD